MTSIHFGLLPGSSISFSGSYLSGSSIYFSSIPFHSTNSPCRQVCIRFSRTPLNRLPEGFLRHSVIELFVGTSPIRFFGDFSNITVITMVSFLWALSSFLHTLECTLSHDYPVVFSGLSISWLFSVSRFFSRSKLCFLSSRDRDGLSSLATIHTLITITHYYRNLSKIPDLTIS